MAPNAFDEVFAEEKPKNAFDEVFAEAPKNAFDEVFAADSGSPTALERQFPGIQNRVPADSGDPDEAPIIRKLRAADPERAKKTVSLFDPEVDKEMRPTWDALTQYARGSGYFGDKALRSGPLDKTNYELTRARMSEDFGLDPEDIDSLVKHRMGAQKEAVSRDALGTVHIKDEVLARSLGDIKTAVWNSKLPDKIKMKVSEELPERVQMFKDGVLQSVKQNHPEFAAGIEFTGDVEKDYAALNAALNKTKGAQFQSGAEAAFTSRSADFAGAEFLGPGDYVPAIQRPPQDVRADIRGEANRLESVNQISNLINQEKVRILGTDAAVIGQGVYSGAESVVMGAVTGGLGNAVISADRIAKAGKVGAAALKFSQGVLNTSPIAGFYGADQAINTYEQAREAGKSPGEAAWLSATSGAIEFGVTAAFGGTNFSGIENVGQRLANPALRREVGKSVAKAWKDLGVDVAKGFGGEITEESIITALDTVAVQAELNPNMTVGDLKKAVYDTVVATTFAAGPMVTVGGVREQGGNLLRTPKPDPIEAAADTLAGSAAPLAPASAEAAMEPLSATDETPVMGEIPPITPVEPALQTNNEPTPEIPVAPPAEENIPAGVPEAGVQPTSGDADVVGAEPEKSVEQIVEEGKATLAKRGTPFVPPTEKSTEQIVAEGEAALAKRDAAKKPAGAEGEGLVSKPFTGEVWRGEPRTPKPADFKRQKGVYSGEAHGIGQYYGLKQDAADRFSIPGTVKSSKVDLKNALVLSNDQQVQAARDLASEVSGYPITSSYAVPMDGPEAEAFTKAMTQLGYDGVVLDFKEAHGGEQVIKFPTPSPQETPTESLPAGQAAPAPAGAAAGVTRDATKPGQMTPAEYDAAFRDMAESREKGTPEKATVELRENHIRDIKDAIREELDTAAEVDPQIGFMGPQYPLSAEAVDTYGIKLPEGYVKRGDLYVYQPAAPVNETPVSDTRPENVPKGQAAPAPTEEQAAGVDTDLRRAVLSAKSRDEVSDAIAQFLPTRPEMSPTHRLLQALSDKASRKGYVPDDITEEGLSEAKKAGLVSGTKNFKLTGEGQSELRTLDSAHKSAVNSYADAADIISDKAIGIWDAENEPSSPLYKAKTQPAPIIDEYLATEDLTEGARYAAEQTKAKAERTGVTQYLVSRVDGYHIVEDAGSDKVLAIAEKPSSPAPYSPESLKTAFGLTDEQAVVADAIRAALGARIDLVAKGGVPGSGALSQSEAKTEEQFNNEIAQQLDGKWDSLTPAGKAINLKNFAVARLAEKYASADDAGGQKSAQLHSIRIGGRGVSVRFDVRGNVESEVLVEPSTGSVSIVIGGKFLDSTASFKGTEFAAKVRIARMIEEEVIHAAERIVHLDRVGVVEDYLAASNAEAAKVFDDIVVSAKTLEEKNLMVQAVRASVGAYNQLHPDSMELVFLDINTLPQSATDREKAHITGELVRQIIQLRKSGQMTETSFQSVMKRMLDWLTNYLNVLKSVAAKPESLGPRFAQEVRDTEAVLASLNGGKPLFQSTAADTARFNELTKDLDPKDIEGWKASHPEELKEITAMRERVLRAAGYDVGPVYHGSNALARKEFTVFSGAKGAAPGFWFSSNREWSARHGLLTKVFLRNPTAIGDDFSIPENRPEDIKLADPLALDASGKLITPDQWGDTGNPSILYQFAGENANVPQFMRDSLDTAKAMAAAGKPSEEIRAVTGWFPGKYDGKLRWEIPDAGAKLRLAEFRKARAEGDTPQDVVRDYFSKKQEAEMESAMDKAFELEGPELVAFSREFEAKKKAENIGLNTFYMNGENRERGRIPLGYILDHTALFEAYPDLKWMPVSFSAEDIGSDATVLGAFNPNFDGITINPLIAFDDAAGALSTLLHEVQHAIQTIEGTAKGSNPQAFTGDTSKGRKAIADSLIDFNEALEPSGVDPISMEDMEMEDDAFVAVIERLEEAKMYLDENEGDAAEEAYQKLVKAMRAGLDTPQDLYNRTAGEIEARDVQARANMTPEQLAATAPYSSENIAPETAIVMFQNNQGNKASFEITETGKILLRGLQNPDFTSAVHEIAHAARRAFQSLVDAGILTAKEVTSIEQWAGAKKGKPWGRYSEEKWARAWERYFREGKKAPQARLQAVFDKIAGWMAEVYATIKGSPIDVEISPEVRAIMDKLAGRMVVPETAERSSQEILDGVEHVWELTREDYNRLLGGRIDNMTGEPFEPRDLPSTDANTGKWMTLVKENRDILRKALPDSRAILDNTTPDYDLIIAGKPETAPTPQDTTPDATDESRVAEIEAGPQFVSTPDHLRTPAGSMYTEDGSDLPPAINDLPENFDSLDPVAQADATAGYLRGIMEKQSTVPPEPVIPNAEDWNPEGLFSLQKRASLDEAARFGLETDWKQASRTFGQLWDIAVSMEAAYTGSRSAGSDLLDNLVAENKLGRPLSDKQIALLTHEGLRRKMAVQRTLNSLTEATVNSDSEGVKEADFAHREAMAAFQALQNVAAGARTESGRSLNAWKYALRDDFSYATLFTRHLANLNSARKQQGLEPVSELPESERKALNAYAQKQQARLDLLEAAKAELEAKTDEQGAKLAEQEALIEELRADLKSSSKKSAVKETTKKLIKDRVSKAAAEARERLAAAKEINLEGGPIVLYQAANAQADPLWNDRILVMAESLLAEPGMSETRFAELVKTRFGTAVAAGAADLHQATRDHLRDTMEDVTGVHVATPAEVMSEVGTAEAVTREVVIELARAHIYEGARNSEVIDRVHETLHDEFPEITRSQVAQLFTRYGEISKKTPDELEQAYNTARSIELVQKQIDNLESEGVMKRTGRTKEKVEIELRKLRKKRDDLAKELGYTPVDPETQLSSPQTAAKKRMQNEIEELKAAIETGTRRVRVRRGVEYTEDMKALRDELTTLRATYEDTFGQERSPAEIDALLLKDLDRRIAKEESLIERGLLAEPDTGKPAHIASVEVVARRQKLADLRQQKRDAYERANPGQTALNQAMEAAHKAVQRRLDTLSGKDSPRTTKERGEGVSPTDDLKRLWKAADAMTDYIREIRKARPLTPAQHQKQLDDAYDAAVASREALRLRIKTGDILPATSTRSAAEARTEAVRKENAALRKQIVQMQKDAGVGVFDPVYRQAKREESLLKRLAEIKRMRADKDYAKKPRTEPATNETIREIEMEIYLEKHDFETERAKHVFDTLGVPAQLRSTAGALWQARMMLNLTGDFGVIDRQLGKLNVFLATQDLKSMWRKFKATGRVKLSDSMIVDTLVKAYRSFMNESDQIAEYRRMATDPKYPGFKKNGFNLLNPHDTSHELNAEGDVRLNPLTVVSDRVLAGLMVGKGFLNIAAGLSTGNLVGGIGKGVAQTLMGTAVAVGGRRVALRVERANQTILNVARWHILEAALQLPGAVDPSTSPNYDRDVTIAVMNLTGKTAGTGKVSQFFKNNAYVIGGFISFPQYRWTNLQSVTLGPLSRIGFGHQKANREAAKTVSTLYGYWMAGWTMKILVASALLGAWGEDDDEGDEAWGFGIVLNPKNPNFGTLKVGRTFIDFASGARTWIVDIMQMVQSEQLDREYLRDGYEKIAKKSPNDRGQAFDNWLNKIVNPNLRTIKDWWITREFRQGGQLDRMNWLNKMDTVADEILMNLTVREFNQIMEANGPVKGSAIFTYLMLGNNSNVRETNYERGERKAEEAKRYVR